MKMNYLCKVTLWNRTCK